MTTPTRIRLSRAKGWRMPDNTVKVDRSTAWGNPFVVGTDGTADECVYLYKHLISGHLALTAKADITDQEGAHDWVHQHWRELRGKNLACWCALDRPCHADVLLTVANAPIPTSEGEGT